MGFFHGRSALNTFKSNFFTKNQRLTFHSHFFIGDLQAFSMFLFCHQHPDSGPNSPMDSQRKSREEKLGFKKTTKNLISLEVLYAAHSRHTHPGILLNANVPRKGERDSEIKIFTVYAVTLDVAPD